MPSRAFLLLLAVTALLPAQNVKLPVRGAGEISVRHGSVRYRPELYQQAQPGFLWRMGSNGATQIESEAALVWKEDVILPGSYDLNARMVDDTRWDLIFHHDGPFYNRKGAVGEFALEKGQVASAREEAKTLAIDLLLHPDKAERKKSVCMFRVRFGPHQAVGQFRALPMVVARAKIGRVATRIEMVAFSNSEEDLARFSKEKTEQFLLGRIILPGQKMDPLHLQFSGGEEPTLRVMETKRVIQGTRREGGSSMKKLSPKFSKGVLTLKIGKLVFDFPIGQEHLTPAGTGSTTGG